MARSTGPALSGVLISIFGTGFSYSVQAVFFLHGNSMDDADELVPLQVAHGRRREP
jgi:hypothetical protein